MNPVKYTIAAALAACLATFAEASDYFDYVKSVGITKVNVTTSKAKVRLGKGGTMTRVPQGSYDIVDIVNGKVVIKIQGKQAEIPNAYIDFDKQLQAKGAKSYIDYFREKAKGEHEKGAANP